MLAQYSVIADVIWHTMSVDGFIAGRGDSSTSASEW
jgi:hypothetical protein